MRKVLFVYKFLPHYRMEFFQQLRNALYENNVELHLIYGKSNSTDASRKDEIEIEWAQYIPNKRIRIGKKELIWQPIVKFLKDKDLVIVQPENRLLLNYYLMFARHYSKFKFAFWGHGRDMQADMNSFLNRFKYMFINKCDWWFAYTNGVKEFVMEKKYAEDRITVVQNAIDTLNLRDFYSGISIEEIQEINKQLGINNGKTAIFCGGMYPEKRLDFIIKTCHRIKAEIPDFHMLFLGSGVDSDKVIAASDSYEWIHYVGPKFGNDRVKYFKISAIQLMPGLVGLGVLDSFAMETPIITTEYPYHSPEVEYIRNGVNGIITTNTLDDYVYSIIEILKTDKYLDLIKGCKYSADVYTVEKMTDNFKKGILECLEGNYKPE